MRPLGRPEVPPTRDPTSGHAQATPLGRLLGSAPPLPPHPLSGSHFPPQLSSSLGAQLSDSPGFSLRDPPWIAAPLKPEASVAPTALPPPADLALASTVRFRMGIGVVVLPSPLSRPLPPLPTPKEANFFFFLKHFYSFQPRNITI